MFSLTVRDGARDGLAAGVEEEVVVVGEAEVVGGVRKARLGVLNV